jgi:hypothetical protein
MWEPHRPTALCAFTACYMDSFTFYLHQVLLNWSNHEGWDEWSTKHVWESWETKKLVEAPKEKISTREIYNNIKMDHQELEYEWWTGSMKELSVETVARGGNSQSFPSKHPQSFRYLMYVINFLRSWSWRIQFSEMWRYLILFKFTNISEERS